jgi:50S ribosomal subunit-associated GTPase HflX
VDGAPGAIGISARSGDGVAALLERIDALLPVDPIARACFRIPHEEGAAIHLLHEYARVIEKRFEGEYAEILADAPESVRKRLARFVAE